MTVKLILAGILLFAAIAAPWYLVQLSRESGFFRDHFIGVGLRNKTLASYFHIETYLPLFYLHMGVRKWYYLWLASLALILMTMRFLKSNFLMLLLWNAVILYPFLTSNETHIWHLIPVYLPMSLIIAGSVHWGKELFVRLTGLYRFRRFFDLCYLVIFVFLACWQVRNFTKEVYPTSRFVPDDVDISRKAAAYGMPLYLDDNFKPVAVFYSGHNVKWMTEQPVPENTPAGLFGSGIRPFCLITRNNIVAELRDKGYEFTVLEKNNYLSIVTGKIK